jgi:hypothetical protein
VLLYVEIGGLGWLVDTNEIEILGGTSMFGVPNLMNTVITVVHYRCVRSVRSGSTKESTLVRAKLSHIGRWEK